MILISHRGNLDSKNEELENDPTYIDNALNHGYNVEIDLWVNSNVLYLGHDSGKYEVQLDWLTSRVNKLWIHCKNIQAVEYMNSKEEYNYLRSIDKIIGWQDYLMQFVMQIGGYQVIQNINLCEHWEVGDRWNEFEIVTGLKDKFLIESI